MCKLKRTFIYIYIYIYIYSWTRHEYTYSYVACVRVSTCVYMYTKESSFIYFTSLSMCYTKATPDHCSDYYAHEWSGVAFV